MSIENKQPIGLKPEWLHKEIRLKEINEAIDRYIEANQPVPLDWIVEQRIITLWLQNRKEEKESAKAASSHSVQKDWEVISLSYDGDKITKYALCIYGFLQGDRRYKDFSIHSVIRVSDSEVFTIGDTFTYEGLRANNWEEGAFPTIKSFNIYSGDIYINEHYKGTQRSIAQWMKLPPPEEKPVLFTTEDGFNVYEGDWYFYVEEKNNNFTVVSHSGITKKRPHKYFSSRDAANEYVIMNRSLLSLEDLLSHWGNTTREHAMGTVLFGRFKELAQSKINQHGKSTTGN